MSSSAGLVRDNSLGVSVGEEGEVRRLLGVKGEQRPKDTQWIYGLQQQIVCGHWALTMCHSEDTLRQSAGQSGETPTIPLGQPWQFSYFSKLMQFSLTAQVLTLNMGASSFSKKTDKISVLPSDHPSLHMGLGAIGEVSSTFCCLKKENHRHLVIPHMHSRVLSAI